MNVVYVACFGVLGVLARYGASLFAAGMVSGGFPWGTLVINIVGSFLAGCLYVAGLERAMLSPELRIGIMVGFLGGFTTFSSFSLETARLIQEGAWSQAAFYFLGSPILGLAAAGAGLWMVRGIWPA